LGIYDLGDVDDPHVPSTLLKLWLRELAEPVIPSRLYNECVNKSGDPESYARFLLPLFFPCAFSDVIFESLKRVINIVRRLPKLNRRVVVYVITFLQLFTAPEVVEITKMPINSLALVFAPNFFRCQADSLAVVFNNAKWVFLLPFFYLLSQATLRLINAF
jgi:hypothetical protein